MVTGTHLSSVYREHEREVARRYRFVAKREPLAQGGLDRGKTPPSQPSKSRTAAATTTLAAIGTLDILA
jgi:hypothetical protein